MDDPNLSDKNFRVTHEILPLQTARGEVSDWQGHSPEQLKTMHDHLVRLKQEGVEAVDD